MNILLPQAKGQSDSAPPTDVAGPFPTDNGVFPDGEDFMPIMPEINLIEGTDGDDTLKGGDKDDHINGYGGNDILSGGGGRDGLDGGEGNDKLSGGKDFDFLSGGAGNDTLTGGEGQDIFAFGSWTPDGFNGKSGNDVITDFNPGEDMLDFFATGLEFVDLTIKQVSGDTLISWDEGSVLLEDVTDTVDESWFMIGGIDPDGPISIMPTPDDSAGPNGNVGGGTDDGTIEPIMPEINLIEGTDGDDTLSGGDKDDYVNGYGGNDILIGGSSQDFLSGGTGNDNLSGGDGADFLSGGAGNDTLTGGEGQDSFAFGSWDRFGANDASGNDVITDFNPGEDMLDFFATGLEFADLTIKQTNGDTLISWDEGSLLLEGITDTVDENWFLMNGYEPGVPLMDVGMDF